MRNICVEMDIVQNEYPTTFTLLSLSEQTKDTAQYVASRFVSDLPENLSFAEIGKHIDEIVTKANSYLFDAVYSDANKMSFCENCAYEWANLFWGQLFTHNAILRRYGHENYLIEKVSQDKTKTLFCTESGTAEFVYDTTLQSVPINETEKRIEETYYSAFEEDITETVKVSFEEMGGIRESGGSFVNATIYEWGEFADYAWWFGDTLYEVMTTTREQTEFLIQAYFSDAAERLTRESKQVSNLCIDGVKEIEFVQ